MNDRHGDEAEHGEAYSDMHYTRFSLVESAVYVVDEGLAQHVTLGAIVGIGEQRAIAQDVVDNQAVFERLASRVGSIREAIVEAVEEVRIVGEVDRHVVVGHTRWSN